jgi:hypothetical protein
MGQLNLTRKNRANRLENEGSVEKTLDKLEFLDDLAAPRQQEH